MAPQFADPLKKREEFSVHLRKQKKQEIIETKRKRILLDHQRRLDDAKNYQINHVDNGHSN